MDEHGETRGKVLQKLDELGIAYDLECHPAVYTIDEMDALKLKGSGNVVKNLFLRDDKGRRHFLLMLRKDKTANLKAIREQLGSSALGFASEDRLARFLGLEKGAVTPLGVINDVEGAVEVLVDRDLVDCPCLGVHPNENTATVWLSFADLKRLTESDGRTLRVVEVP